MPSPPRRFLFVVPPLAGHVNPTVALGAALAEAGHSVAWAGSELFLRPLMPPTAAVHGTGSRLLRAQDTGGVASVRTLWENFVVPYARFTGQAVDRAVEAFRPDVVVVDEHTPAGALAAERRGLPWATLATSAMELGDPLRAEHPELAEWIVDRLRALWAGAGLAPAAFVDPRASPHLVLALTTPGLAGPAAFPPHYALVGPMLGGRPPGPAFPWEALDPDRRRVLVTTGTLAADVSAGFHHRVVVSLGRLGDRVQGLVVGGPEPPPEGWPDSVLTFPRVPMLDLLVREAVHAVVCHGGLNSVTEALAHRVPVVVAPIRHDQPITAARVAASGAGVRVDFEKSPPEELAAAIESVLDDPGPRRAAARLAAEFADAGGVRTALARLEDIAANLARPADPDRDQGDPA